MRAWRACAIASIAVIVGGCGGGGAKKVVGPAPVDAGARKAAEQAVRQTMAEAYGSLRRGDTDGLQSLLDPAVFVVGPGAGHIYSNRADAIVALSNGFPRKKHKLASKLQVTASPSGKSAFVTDELTLDKVKYRLSAVLVDVDGFWVATVIHVGRPGAAGQRDLPPLAGPADTDAAAADVVALHSEAAATPERLVDQLADHVVVLGSGPKEVTRGAKAVKKRWKKQLLRIAPKGAVRAHLTPDGQLGWVAANVDVTGGAFVRTERSLFVYERTPGGWLLVGVHGSAAGK